MQFWDSVSILPGDGTGRLTAATTFALGTVPPGDFQRDPLYPYQNFQHQLNTSDLNGDRRSDLIASPGVTLLNRPAAANRPPSAFAGPDPRRLMAGGWQPQAGSAASHPARRSDRYGRRR